MATEQKKVKDPKEPKERDDYLKNMPILAAYTGTCNKIIETEKKLADLREKEKVLLKSNPWLAQVKGLARKKQKAPGSESLEDEENNNARKRSKSTSGKPPAEESTASMVTKRKD